MMLNQLFHNKKGQQAIPLAIAIILFNIFSFIIINAFAIDAINVGNSHSSLDLEVSNESVSTDTDLSVTEAKSWFQNFKSTFFDLPWWIQVFLTFINVGGIILVIIAIIRGI